MKIEPGGEMPCRRNMTVGSRGLPAKVWTTLLPGCAARVTERGGRADDKRSRRRWKIERRMGISKAAIHH